MIIKIPNNPYTTEGIPANNSTADLIIFLTFGFAISAKLTAVKIPIGTPIKIAKNTPTIDVKIMFKIPYCGLAAVGAHTLLNKISVNPTLKIAGVPETNIYAVIPTTATIETTAQQIKITEAVFSTIDFVFLFAIILIVFLSIFKPLLLYIAPQINASLYLFM